MKNYSYMFHIIDGDGTVVTSRSLPAEVAIDILIATENVPGDTADVSTEELDSIEIVTLPEAGKNNLHGDGSHSTPRQKKWHKANGAGKALQKEIEQVHTNKAGDRTGKRLVSSSVEDIAAAFNSGMDAEAVADKFGISLGYAYTTKSKAKKMGLLVEKKEEALPVGESQAFGPDRYKAIRNAMHDREFQSAKYALVNKLSPREVNCAVRSTSYDDYLDIRV